MSAAPLPDVRDGQPVWSYSAPGLELRFTGRGVRGSLEVACSAAGARWPTAHARQVHSARVLEACPGECGEGDALVTSKAGLTLAIAVADCVPIAVWGSGELALIHAGWRGIFRGVVPAAVAALASPAGRLNAWIGPAMGACCYEVGPDVARQVAAVSDPDVVVAGEDGGRPRLDLRRAVRTQLRSAGVSRSESLDLCTACEGESLWSHRKSGVAAGRNYAFAWIPDAG